jgi:hypothetical protein
MIQYITKEEGRRNVLIAYVGIAAAVDLIRTVRPAWESVFALQPFNLDRTLSSRGWKASLREAPNNNGRPKWKVLEDDNLKGMIPKILEILADDVFLLKRIDDFPELTFCPDQLQYLWRQVEMEFASEEVALPKMIKSSAKSRWFIGGQALAIRIPLSSPIDSRWWNSRDRTSVPKIKRKGENGSPWRKPLDGVNFPKGEPLSKIEKEEDDTQLVPN